MSAKEALVGGWTAYHEITSAELAIFNTAMEGFVGVHYDPTSVSTQVVAGMNYRFKCEASMPPSEVIWQAIVEIYQPLKGIPHITNITKL
jgi:hypothetical protein